MVKPGKHKGSVRIISGKWRGRRIPVAEVPGLRPTGDRVRETLFNWLQAYLPGSRCLDVFAGTGVLGLEAVSRGATCAVLLEQNSQAVSVLQDFMAGLVDAPVEIRQADSLTCLAEQPDAPYDVVFVDPPFDLDVQQQVLQLLSEHVWLAPGALVYVESPVQKPATTSPPELREARNKLIGDVRLQLFTTLP